MVEFPQTHKSAIRNGRGAATEIGIGNATNADKTSDPNFR
jgi:hypothetical protein